MRIYKVQIYCMSKHVQGADGSRQGQCVLSHLPRPGHTLVRGGHRGVRQFSRTYLDLGTPLSEVDTGECGSPLAPTSTWSHPVRGGYRGVRQSSRTYLGLGTPLSEADTGQCGSSLAPTSTWAHPCQWRTQGSAVVLAHLP